MGKRIVRKRTDNNALITVDDLAKVLKESKVAIYNRIRHGIILAADLDGRQKLLDARHARIRYHAAEEVRRRKSYSLERIGGLFQQVKADVLIRQGLESGKPEKTLVGILADKMSE